jgi:hypothetical protein
MQRHPPSSDGSFMKSYKSLRNQIQYQFNSACIRQGQTEHLQNHGSGNRQIISRKVFCISLLSMGIIREAYLIYTQSHFLRVYLIPNDSHFSISIHKGNPNPMSHSIPFNAEPKRSIPRPLLPPASFSQPFTPLNNPTNHPSTLPHPLTNKQQKKSREHNLNQRRMTSAARQENSI